MSDSTPPESEPTRQPSAAKIWVLGLCPVVLACAVAIIGLYLSPAPSSPSPSQTDQSAEAPLEQGTYYCWVKHVEFNAHKINGNAWDSKNGAPDPRVALWWQNQLIWESDTRKNCLIANWEALGMKIKPSDLVNGVSLNQADLIRVPQVRYDPQQPATHLLRLVIKDSDALSDDLAADLSVSLADLHLGDNAMVIPAESPLARVVVRIVDGSLDTPTLAQRLQAPLEED